MTSSVNGVSQQAAGANYKPLTCKDAVSEVGPGPIACASVLSAEFPARTTR